MTVTGSRRFSILYGKCAAIIFVATRVSPDEFAAYAPTGNRVDFSYNANTTGTPVAPLSLVFSCKICRKSDGGRWMEGALVCDECDEGLKNIPSLCKYRRWLCIVRTTTVILYQLRLATTLYQLSTQSHEWVEKGLCCVLWEFFSISGCDGFKWLH